MKLWFVEQWAMSHGEDPIASLTQFANDPTGWDSRFENYKYAAMFAILGKKRGIRKYYAGWETFTTLAARNIRFLLQLVEFSLREHINRNRHLGEPIPPLDQTRAARRVGESNIEELEGIDVDGVPEGARIVRLLMGLGRIFEIFAADPFGHAPEINQFWIPDLEDDCIGDQNRVEIERVLRAGVMHLALDRSASNKLGSHEPRVFNGIYSVHPIFSAYFQYSHRKKRKMKLSVDDILGLINNQRAVIDRVLRRHNRVEVEEGESGDASDIKASEQLGLFPPSDMNQ